MDNTKQLDFSLQNKSDLVGTEDYVVLQAGKGKKDNSIIYIKAFEFSYIEGMIWDKNREFSHSKKTKISTHDWNRVLEGFSEASERLSGAVGNGDIKTVLQFNIYKERNPLSEVLNYTNEINQLLKDLNEWVLEHIHNEKHITILKSHL